MNRSGSRPNHENRQIIIPAVLIRRGGAPSGAAAYIVIGGMGVRAPISFCLEGFGLLWKYPQNFHSVCLWPQASCPFFRENIQGTLTLPGLRFPPLRRPGCDSVVLPIHKTGENFSGGDIEASYASPLLRRTGLHKGGRSYLMEPVFSRALFFLRCIPGRCRTCTSLPGIFWSVVKDLTGAMDINPPVRVGT